MKTALILLAAMGLLLGDFENGQYSLAKAAEAKLKKSSEQVLAEAFKSHRSDFQIQVQGKVIKVLPDDNNGSRHQRFIVKLSSGQTLMVAHNIDLAPSVDNLQAGDNIELYGEYEWNEKGGTLHWTHRDPGRRHVSGWIKHAGKLYQ